MLLSGSDLLVDNRKTRLFGSALHGPGGDGSDPDLRRMKRFSVRAQ
jgi:hypothetical protein